MRIIIKGILALLFLALLSGCPDGMIGLGDKVDLDPPSLVIGSYEDGTPISNGDYVRGTILLSGSVSDDTGVKSVRISVEGADASIDATLGGDGTSWSAPVDTARYGDGEKEILLTVTDKAPEPRTYETRLLLFFDNTPPVVLVKEPSGYESTDFTDSIISLKGEASDPFRVRRVDVSLEGGSGSLGDVEGTNTWNCTFESPGTGSYIFRVSAEDYAGNVSTHFYHYDDILTADGNVYMTPEEIYDVENGVAGKNITPSGLKALELDEMTLSISMELDNPDITISNPDPSALVVDNVMSGSAKFLGSVSDDDGVDTSTLEIRFDNGFWEPVGRVNGSGRFVTWTHTRTYTSSGDHYFQIRVDDIYGVSQLSPLVNFRINVDAAKVDIDFPAMSQYLNVSDYTITGTALDTGGGVTDLQISLDEGSTWNEVDTTPSLPSESVSWSYRVEGGEQGSIPVKMRASDDSGGTWSYTNVQYTVDTTAPITSFVSPAGGSYVNGDVTLRGSCTDNNQLASVRLKIGDDPAEPWIDIDEQDLYSWTYTFASDDYENGTAGDETAPGSGVYAVNCYIEATDKAGNVKVTPSGAFVLNIDNELDKPSVTVISPRSGDSVGGSVLLTGTSYDDDGEVYGVYVQLDVNTPPGGEPDFADKVSLSGGGIDFDGSGSSSPVTLLDETKAYLAEGSSPWSVSLNSSGELYSTEAGHSGDIYARIWAVDKDGGADSVAGDVQTLHFRFDDTIPVIGELTPSTESYVKDTFTIEGNLSDETQIKHLEVSYDGGTSYHYIIKDGTVQPGYSGAGSAVNTDYAISLPVNTASIPDVGGVTSDDILIRFKATDNTNYQSQESLVYYVDNNLPTAWMTQDTSDIYGSGDNGLFTGFADDEGTVSGVERVVLYIEKDGFFYDQKDGTAAALTTEEINGSDTPFPSDPDYLMTIDSTVETLSGSNSDGDGLEEELNVGSFYEWKARINSTNIPDGVATLHYVAYDRAQNRVHGSQMIFVKNDKPSITSVDVGYDLDGNGTVEGDEIFPYTGEFKARSRLYFHVNATDGGGITQFRLYEGSDSSGSSVLSASEGQLDISSLADGEYTYFCQVTDGDGITAEKTILVEIDNVDDDAPVVTLDSLSRESVVDGHLEPAGASLLDGSDADVSGTVKFTGRVSDDQGIEEFRLNLDGNETVLANWENGYFVSRASGFTIDEQTFDPGLGHQISWTYVWNSAEVTGVAALDVIARFTAVDFADTANSDEKSLTFDVVPYISGIDTYLSSAFDSKFARSARGAYPVWVNSADGGWETVVLSGYNLNPVGTGGAGSDVRLSSDGDSLDGSGQKTGKGLIYTGVNATYTSLQADMRIDGAGALDGSGYLTVFTNGIPSINNINDNGGNGEADVINPSLNDDRKLQVWDLRLLKNEFSLAKNAVYPSMSMNGDTPEFAYQNNSQGWGISLYNDGTTEKYVYENWDLFTFSAIDHNSSGDHASLYDINVVNGNFGDFNSGNYGGILMTLFEDVPATSWDYWAYRINDNQIWLENLVDETRKSTAVLDRYRYPDISLKGNSGETDVFYTLYDRLNDKIIFRHFLAGTSGGIAGGMGGRINNEGTAIYASVPQYEPDGSFPEYDGNEMRFVNNNQTGKTPAGRQELVTENTGEFTAVDGTADGSTAVVAWYDAAGTGRIRLMYNIDPDNGDTWETIGADSLIDSGHGGEYLDLRIDSGNNIHLAYYDNNNGDLRYIYIPVNDFASGSFGEIQKMVVDSYLDVGDRLTLELNGGDKPFIAYKGVNRSGKAAWMTGSVGPGVNGDDEYTGLWEVSILPAKISNTDSNRFCVGVDTHGLPVVGYTNGGIEYIRMLGDLAD